MVKSLVAIFFAILWGMSFAGTAYAKQPASCNDTKSGKTVDYKLEKGNFIPFSINNSLSRTQGNTKRGREIFVNPELGNCIACHAVKKLQSKIDVDDYETTREFGYPGDIGPSLDQIGSRYTTGELRVIVVDPKIAFPTKDVTMPAYYKREGLVDPAEGCVGKTILNERQIEDLVRYLGTLK